ncbi:MAG TPA: ATP-binding protein [Armatimonadota bacterium]|jgi:hypothetical protein
MYYRNITPRLLEALGDSPVVLVIGARQTGKTTLVQSLPGERFAAEYITLDDSSALSAVADARGFVAGLSGPAIIDEVQHAPGLFPAIKASVDRDRRPGRFLLTGSANVLLLPKLSESLAGRMEILTLWPLAQAEIAGRRQSIVDTLFSSTPFPSGLSGIPRDELAGRIVSGGYPEPLSRQSEARRHAWFDSYLTTILRRDVRDIANIEGLSRLPRLLSLLAARTAGLLNMSDISTTAGIPYATLHRYFAVLEATFLVQLLPAWSGNLTSRLIKTPKLVMSDSGMAASLLGENAERLLREGPTLGPLLETFVAMEFRKDAGWSETRPALFHYRTHARQEVDIVLESPSGDIVGIEVKAATSVNASDFRGLRSLQEAAGERFVRGVVFYTGDNVTPFAERLHAVPISLLWS